jgi:ankyrin repeat protein
MNLDFAGRGPFHYAALHDEVSTVTELIASDELLDLQDRQGFAPLHFAAQQFAI